MTGTTAKPHTDPAPRPVDRARPHVLAPPRTPNRKPHHGLWRLHLQLPRSPQRAAGPSECMDDAEKRSGHRLPRRGPLRMFEPSGELPQRPGIGSIAGESADRPTVIP
jgi:hypothetical protein